AGSASADLVSSRRTEVGWADSAKPTGGVPGKKREIAPAKKKPAALSRLGSMQPTLATSSTSARANSTSSTPATQHGPTFQALPMGPGSPVGNAMITPSASVCAG